MPKMDGREALKEIKQDPDLKKLPVVVFTTSSNDNDIQSCYDLGANSYIIKPHDFSDYRNLVNRLHDYWTESVTFA